ncbi:MAG: protein phosphatase 2C domain-containing protein [Ignavibacteriaceae bacterium]|jgi:protein phosphatase
MKYKYTATTQAGDGRPANEDFIGVHEVEDGILVIVCDGVGISNGSNIAAKLCVASIQKDFCSSDNPDYLKRIKSSLSFANEMLRNYSDEYLGGVTLVTTADVLFLHNQTVYWGHIGDSRIYNIKNGTLHRMTKDHSLVQQLIDEGFLTMKEAEYHPDRNVILRALGEVEDVDIDLSKMHFNQFDKYKFLVCTDGVSKVISEDELETLMKRHAIYKCTEQIKKLISSRKTPDDYSFVLLGAE